jgi:futalosine hydrolase
MLITIVSATALEVLRLRNMLAPDAPPEQAHFTLGKAQIHLLQTGIGLTNTALYLSQYLHHHRPNLVIHAGIAGSFKRSIPLGTVGLVISETFADLGIELADSSFQDFFSNGLLDADVEPFEQGRLWNRSAEQYAFLPQWHGLSVQKVTGAQPNLDQMVMRYPFADIESMEGAAFFQTCQAYAMPHLAIRAISNYVEPRNRANWRIGEAVEALNRTVYSLIQMLSEGAE